MPRLKELAGLVRTKFYAHRLPVLLLGVMTVILSWEAFFSQGIYPSGIDTPAHIFKVQVMQDMLSQHGSIFRWSSQWYAGYPFLSLYAPVTYYVLLGFQMLVDDITLAFNLFRMSLLFLTGFFTYLILSNEDYRRQVSILGGILTMAAVPLHNNLFGVGRVPFAMGIVLYLASLCVLTRDEIYSSTINRYHLVLSIILSLLVITHPMSAYFLFFTGIFLALTKYEDVLSLGFRPVILVGGLVALLSAPYLMTFLRHSYLTDPFWIRASVMEELSRQVTRQFQNFSPRYLGQVSLHLFAVGLISLIYRRTRFKIFALLNFAFFYLMFWSQNLGFMRYFPLNSQFDMPRFEIMFSLWLAFFAAIGAKELFDYLADADLGSIWNSAGENKYWLMLTLVIALTAVDVAPLIESTSNWSPEFETSQSFDMNDSYNAIMAGGRHWDDYIIPREFEMRDTFGWFQQADPHYKYSQSLQNTGGLWYPTDPDFPKSQNKTLRKNLLRLSNTKYIIFAKEWVPEDMKKYVIAKYYTPFNEQNRKLYRDIEEDQSFETVHNSSSLEVFELQQEMSYCESAEPIWISEDYFRESRNQLSTESFPELPVEYSGTVQPEGKNLDSEVRCSTPSPYNIEIRTNRPTWVLVKESKYPYWHRKDGAKIFNAFGFMVTHVNGTAELNYDPRYSKSDETIRS